MDLLSLDKTVTKIDSESLPEAAQLANGVLTNAAALLNGAVNNAAVLMAQLLQGAEAERTEAMNGLTAVLAPLIAESAAWRGEVSRLCDILERISLKP